ncbi:kunitz-type protease inhibitor 2 isoform X2 [Toxotes jaculatrix]|uniref:kunitz-type protease inhibitor 2 isoform X2 n=1 Tax=Toxotes jaculatrix TaxID=941984 RepID=UPI001B3AC69D|nr:kunitz-type protease inhibitor 2 isoform X2 [Toxotes jaculatrix]
MGVVEVTSPVTQVIFICDKTPANAEVAHSFRGARAPLTRVRNKESRSSALRPNRNPGRVSHPHQRTKTSKNMLRLCLLALYFLVWSGQALNCEWDQSIDPDQGLDPASADAGALHLDALAEVSDPESCRAACCDKPDCDLALVSYPADGAPRCLLVSCVSRGRDVCVLQPSSQFKVYRRKVKREASGEKPHVVPLLGSWEPKTNETTNIGCRLPVKVGSCRAAFPKFYYDVTNRSCRSFIYGGCEANANNFDSREECEATCSGVTGSVLPDDSTPASELPAKAQRKAPPFNAETASDEYTERCMAPPDPGHCRAAFPMFFYDHSTETCQSFIYGGCRGNQNRYSTPEECMARCSQRGSFDSRGKSRNRWTAAFFLFVALAVISALLLVTLVLISLRRHRLSRRPSSISDKEELLPDPDEQSSVESLAVPQSPKPDKA